MKLLVIGGMHGNEPLGIKVVRLLQKKKLKNVDAILANREAVDKNCRFKTQDLNRTFPGDLDSNIYEQKRAAYLLEICKKYDLVLDFHNTYCPGNDCSFIGINANEDLFKVSSFLGLNKIIIADYECINKYAQNCISIEISLDSQEMDAGRWCEKISELANVNLLPEAGDIELFRFVYRMTIDDRDKFNLGNKNLKAFEPISDELARSLNVESPAFPIFIGDKFTPYNYGGLLNKIT